MVLSLYTIYVNHHQIPLADELYSLLGDDFHFIEIRDTEEVVKAMSGYSLIDRPYVIRPYKTSHEKKLAFDYAINSDIMLFSTPSSLPYAIKRFLSGKKQITFEIEERWLKKGLLNILSPRLLKNKLVYHTICPQKNTYMLCQGAYVARDEYFLRSYINKCYKWAYFTAVPKLDIKKLLINKRNSEKIRIVWVARFLDWKHPEKMVDLAQYLQKKQVDFEIDMIGEGILFTHIDTQIRKKNLQNCVKLLGVMPNSNIVKLLQTYHIFCFTSDRNEGWGAVLNEAMSAGCCPVASKSIGSVPFLINHGYNGMFYDDLVEDDLEKKVLWLINNPAKREKMSENAYSSMRDVWNPSVAAHRLVEKCNALLNGCDITFCDGPLSQSEIY